MKDLPELILEFWFGRVDSDGFDKRWFQSTPEFDRRITGEFGEALARVEHGAFYRWGEQATSWIAYILLTDQFPRNVHRGEARAFGFDHLALAMAKRGIAMGLDRALSHVQRVFAYLPFEHSECLHDQHVSVALMRQLAQIAPREMQERVRSSLAFAESHREIIQRFGRFPHRNTVLGRTHTSEETAYLKTANRFGQ